jgi:hypothetical protein
MNARSSLSKSMALLGACAAIALATVTSAEASVTALNTNQIIYQPEDRFVLTLVLGPSFGKQTQGDVYVQVTLPDGTTRFLDQNAQFTTAVRPFRANLAIIQPSETEIFSRPFPFALQGTYALAAFQVMPGTDPTNPDNIVGTGLPVRIALTAPTSAAGTNRTVPTPSAPVSVDVNPATGTAVLTRFPNIVSTFNLATNKIVSSIPVPLARIESLGTGDIVVNPITNMAVTEVFTSTGSCSVALIDLNGATITQIIELPAGTGCFALQTSSAIVIDPQRNRAVALSRTQQGFPQDSFIVIDLAAGRVVSTFVMSPDQLGIFGNISAFTLDPANNILIALVFSSFQIILIDLDTGRVMRRLPTGIVTGGLQGNLIALIPQSSRLVIVSGPGFVDSSASVRILNLDTGQLTPSLLLPGIPIPSSRGLAINPVTNQAAVLGLKLPLGGVNPSTLFLVDLATPEIIASFDLPANAASLVFDSGTNTILIAGGFDAPILFLVQPQGLPVNPQTAPLRVTVDTLGTGAPIAGATVAVKQTGTVASTFPGGEAFFSAVPIGPQIVTVSAAGFAPANNVQITIQAGRTNEVTISLVPQAAFGTLKGVVVSAIPPGTSSSPAAVRGAIGQPAPQRARSQDAGTAPQPDQTSPPPCTPQNATPIPGATVTIPSPDGSITVTTQADGTFILQAPAGSVLVGVQAPGQHPTMHLQEVLQDTEACLVVTLLPTLTTVGGVMPSSGPITGGMLVALAGTNFLSGVTVTLGSTPATGVAVANSTTLTAITPAHADGAVDVTITNPDGQAAILPNGYTYVAGSAETRLIGLATRGLVQTGGNVLIGGVIIGGPTPKTVVVRAIGPSMAALGVPGTLANPTLTLFAGSTPIASNDDWGTVDPLCASTGNLCGGPADIAAAGAPSDPLEAALLITLPPGPYTAIVTGVGGSTGVGLVEVYEVP